MITDRTSADAAEAKKIRLNKVKKEMPLTEAEKATMERGAVTLNTLNRIESKQSELKAVINDMGYWGFEAVNKQWTKDDVFVYDDLKRICENTAILRRAFFSLKTTPPNPYAEYDYREFNRLEQILVDIEAQSESIKSLYRICGAYVSGGK